MRYRIINDDVLTQCISEIIRRQQVGIPNVIITDKDETRSQAQNRLYWLWLHYLQSQTGQGDADWHLYYKRNLLAKIYARDDGEMAMLFEQMRTLRHQADYEKTVALPMTKHFLSTTKASTSQFSEYLNQIEVDAYSKGILLPTPEDLLWVREFI
ncbi:hypothetical protein ACFBZI_08485 [Moraxella sp. ZJ142]|uniref:hypothetical protein n=1 Tax=Moraxella marmotae TaxID=3344520 RepID=UPI0035D4AB92